MRLKILGSGNSAGMPLYGCDCLLCAKAKGNKDFRRGPASALLEVDGKRYLIDAGLMNIAEQFPVGSLDGIFITHFHPDHVQGLFQLRWGVGSKIPVFCPPDSHGCADLYKNPGILDFHLLKKFNSFELGYLKVTPLPLIHSKVNFGYLFEFEQQRIAYLTDTKGLPPKTQMYLEALQLDLLIIDTTYPPDIDNSNHNNLNDSLLIQRQLGAKRTVFTHIGHDLDIWLNENVNQLPEKVVAGYDGLVIFPHIISNRPNGIY